MWISPGIWLSRLRWSEGRCLPISALLRKRVETNHKEGRPPSKFLLENGSIFRAMFGMTRGYSKNLLRDLLHGSFQPSKLRRVI